MILSKVSTKLYKSEVFDVYLKKNRDPSHKKVKQKKIEKERKTAYAYAQVDADAVSRVLISCFGFTVLLDSISVFIEPSPREVKRTESIEERKIKLFKQPPPTPTASTAGPFPTLTR